MRRLALLLTSAALLAGSTAAPAHAAPERERWDTRVFSQVPSPGFPAYVLTHRNGRVYAGTYSNPQGDTQRSRVFEWRRDGTLLRSWTLKHHLEPKGLVTYVALYSPVFVYTGMFFSPGVVYLLFREL